MRHHIQTTAVRLLVAALAGAALSAPADWLQQAASRELTRFDGTNLERTDAAQPERRGKVVVRRVEPQCFSDWNNDPTALPYLFYQLRERTQGVFPAYVNNEGIRLTDSEIFDYPLLYFTSHHAFQFSEAEVENLQKFLARGGTLMLDDCTGSGPYMDSVPANVQRIVPGAELELMLMDSEAYRDLFNIAFEVTRMPPLKEQFTMPFQVARYNGRPAIMICPNDYGCSWEISTPPTALNPLGDPAHGPPTPSAQLGREEVYRLSINWLFYALTH